METLWSTLSLTRKKVQLWTTNDLKHYVQSSGRRKLKKVLCSSDLCNCVTSAEECNGDTLQVCGATVQRCQSAAQQCNSEGGWPSSHATSTLYSLSQAFSNHTLIIAIINFSMYIPSLKWKDWIKLSEWTFPSKSRFIRIFCRGLSLNLSKLSSIFSESFRFFFGTFRNVRIYS